MTNTHGGKREGANQMSKLSLDEIHAFRDQIQPKKGRDGSVEITLFSHNNCIKLFDALDELLGIVEQTEKDRDHARAWAYWHARWWNNNNKQPTVATASDKWDGYAPTKPDDRYWPERVGPWSS